MKNKKKSFLNKNPHSLKEKILDKMSNFKVKRISELVYNYSREENLEKLNRTWIDNLWNIVAIPERSLEVETWISKNNSQVLLLKGKHGENLIHWGVLSSISLTMAIMNCGVDINAKDSSGKTPFDWLMERYNFIFVEKGTKLNKDGENRIISETRSVGSYIWHIGARPSESLDNIKSGNDMKLLSNIATGEMWIIKLLYISYGDKVLKGWLSDKRSMIHIWALTPKNPNKKIGFETLLSHNKLVDNILKNKEDKTVLSIDEKDLNGRTALWYTIDALFSKDINVGMVELLLDNVDILLSLGANGDEKDIFGYSPKDLISFKNDKGKSEDFMDYLLAVFEKYNNEKLNAE